MSGEEASPPQPDAEPPAQSGGGGGGCCKCCGSGHQDEDLKKIRAEKAMAFEKGGENDVSNGPVVERRLTDFPCCIIFIVALVCFVVVILAGFSNGQLARLYKPRDVMGNWCGLNDNWNNGPDLENFDYQTYTMNVSKTTDAIMKQLVCSSAAQSYLMPRMSMDEFDSYQCSCCNVPCEPCIQALEQQDPSRNGGSDTDLAGLVSGRMTEIAGLSSVDIQSLFSTSGSNGDLFSTSVLSSATQYLHKVCMTGCDVSYEKIQESQNSTRPGYAWRDYYYKPQPGTDFRKAWDLMSEDATLGAAVNASFVFKAFNQDECPYDDAVWCVPFPGVAFAEAALNYCTLEIAAEVVSNLGETLSDILESQALTDFSNSASASLGEQWGSINSSWGAFFLTCVCSFVIGIVFLVMVRFLAGPCVWLSIVIITCLIAGMAGLCYVKSIQCAGATLFDTGRQTATQVVTYAATTAEQLASGEVFSEDLGVDGNTYRGVQSVSRYGTTCQRWDVQSPHQYFTYGEEPYVAAQGIGAHNRCRNPYTVNQTNKGKTIWCLTNNPDLRWEECLPIGLNPPECPRGYAVTGQTARDVLLYSCYVILGIVALWIIVVICFCKQIMLAIAVTKVAANFLASTPTVLFVPMVQVLAAVLWTLSWFAGAAFILSQVPEDYAPTTYYATYDEAWTACTYDGSGPYGYPVSDVWKDEACGGPNGECFRCKPPRYMLGPGFAYVFFVYLWVSAFFIAVGQCIIAGCVGVWFFKEEKTFKLGGALRTSVWRTCRYHLGSLAFGSFIIAVVQFIRYCMKFLEKQAEARHNTVMVWITRAIQCCIWCFEKSLEYLNKLAYIQIALLGKNFCTSAKKAFYLVLRNAMRFAAVMVLGSAIDGIGFVCILAATTCCGYMIQTSLHPEISPLCPTMVYFCIGYVVGKLYMNVFHLAIDTSLQCFIAAEEMGLDAKHVPKELKNMVKPNKDSSDDSENKDSSS